MHLIRHNSCRVCGSAALTPVIDLGGQHLQGSFAKPGREMPPLEKFPTSLVRCDRMRDERACGLLQMECTIPPDVLYSTYWYRSGTNNTMRTHLRDIAEKAMRIAVGYKETTRVLDIGCNDGTLLESYPADFIRFGIDPCDIAGEIKPPVRVIRDFFPLKKSASQLNGQAFDIVTSIAMYYDLEDPVAFTRDLKKILSPWGIWIFEMSYMPMMLENTSYDTICHEHVEYYSLAVIEYILNRAQMKLIDASLNDINGGSLQCLATHEDNFAYDRDEFQKNIQAMRQKEFNLKLDTDAPYRAFRERVNAHKEELNGLLWKLKREGKRIHVYGASTKGNTILQWCAIDHRIIDCAADRNPEKHGATTLGTSIPIVSEEESRSMNPDYYLVLPWHFKKEFLEREHEALESGIGLIFPLPKIEIIRQGLRNEL